MPLIHNKNHKYVGLRVPVYYQTSKRVSGGSIFSRQPSDRKEGDVEILRVLGVWADIVYAEVRFIDHDIRCNRYIHPSDIAEAIACRNSMQGAEA